MADAYKFDEKAFNDKLTKQTDYLMKFSGKRGYNPYHQIESIRQMKALFDSGVRTKELFDQAAGMKEDLKPVTSTDPEPDPNPKPAGSPNSGPKAA